jgi:hypothetical protein
VLRFAPLAAIDGPLPIADVLIGAAIIGSVIYDVSQMMQGQTPEEKRLGSRPTNAPRGTRPIDKMGYNRGKIHGIKDAVGAGPADWVGITPDGRVIVTDPVTGEAVEAGHVDD